MAEMLMTPAGARPVYTAMVQGMLDAVWNNGRDMLLQERLGAVERAVNELGRMPGNFRDVLARKLVWLDSPAGLM